MKLRTCPEEIWIQILGMGTGREAMKGLFVSRKYFKTRHLGWMYFGHILMRMRN